MKPKKQLTDSVLAALSYLIDRQGLQPDEIQGLILETLDEVQEDLDAKTTKTKTTKKKHENV